MIVRVDLTALRRGARTSDEVCEIDGVGTIAVASARAMLTESLLAIVIADGVDVRNVVHLGRQVTARQRTALIVRDPECVVPGCHERQGLEIDHVEGWSVTRTTSLDALARLCRHHHHQKTYEGWSLHGPPGRWQWRPPAQPAGRESPPACGPPDLFGRDDDDCARSSPNPADDRTVPPRPPPADALPS